MVATVMMARVRALDEASHTIKLDCGSSEDGSRYGNRLTPAVPMIPAMDRALVSQARPGLRSISQKAVSSGPTRPSAGASIIHGWRWLLARSAPLARTTVLPSGFEGPSGPADAVTT